MPLSTVTYVTNKSIETVLLHLRYDSLFSDLPEGVLRELAGLCKIRKVLEGEAIHYRGDEPEGMYLVITGSVRISVLSAQGREALLSIMEAGAWFGESSLFDGLPRAYDAKAQVDTLLLIVPKAELELLLAKRPALYQNIVKLLCQRIRLSLVLLETQALLPLEGRLAQRLLLLAQDGQHVHVKVSQEDLSQMLGTTRQSISRVLTIWQHEGLIVRRYKGIELLNIGLLREKAQAATQML